MNSLGSSWTARTDSVTPSFSGLLSLLTYVERKRELDQTYPPPGICSVGGCGGKYTCVYGLVRKTNEGVYVDLASRMESAGSSGPVFLVISQQNGSDTQAVPPWTCAFSCLSDENEKALFQSMPAEKSHHGCQFSALYWCPSAMHSGCLSRTTSSCMHSGQRNRSFVGSHDLLLGCRLSSLGIFHARRVRAPHEDDP